MTWETRAVCRTRPADWWDTGDEGNRLAMTLCRLACPVIADCLTGDPEPAGVIRAGVAYSDRGLPLPECACGRPIVGHPARPGWCRTCEPPSQQHRVNALPRRHGQHAVFPCGTWQAYQRHVRHREPTCGPCKAARRELRARLRERDRRDLARVRASRRPRVANRPAEHGDRQAA